MSKNSIYEEYQPMTTFTKGFILIGFVFIVLVVGYLIQRYLIGAG